MITLEFANIDQYEIMFKGKKQPNIYKVRPSIKVVKLIGLQSDTLYEIKVYATRHGGINLQTVSWNYLVFSSFAAANQKRSNAEKA